MNIAITRVSTALEPVLPDLRGELLILYCTSIQWGNEPFVIAARMNINCPTKHSDRMIGTASFYERVAFFDSPAKNTAASFNMSLSW